MSEKRIPRRAGRKPRKTPRWPRNLIREYRERDQISQETLAAAVGVDTTTISRWERQISRIPPEKLNAIGDFLKVPEGALMPGPVGYDLTTRERQRIERMRELGESDPLVQGADRLLDLPLAPKTVSQAPERQRNRKTGKVNGGRRNSV